MYSQHLAFISTKLQAEEKFQKNVLPLLQSNKNSSLIIADKQSRLHKLMYDLTGHFPVNKKATKVYTSLCCKRSFVKYHFHVRKRTNVLTFLDFTGN